jgi:hypothetical protein
MVKQRMASADVAGEVSCLKQKILGLRLANIYDLNAKVGTCNRSSVTCCVLSKLSQPGNYPVQMMAVASVGLLV